jgi:hypothetical protein
MGDEPQAAAEVERPDHVADPPQQVGADVNVVARVSEVKMNRIHG